MYNLAISGTKGSSGFGSVSKLHILNNTFDIVNAGDHYFLRMSKQIYPVELTFGWYIFVINVIFGGLKG